MSVNTSDMDPQEGHTSNEGDGVFKNEASNEQLQNISVSERFYSDAVPSSSSAAVGQTTKDETAYDVPGREGSHHSSKTEEKTDKELNSAPGSTIKQLERTKSQRNKMTNKLDEITNVIGTGPSYSGGGIKKTFHGVSYQMKLAMLFTVRGLKQKCNFQVATEVEEAGKLDDLVFLYEDDEIGFLQAKHRLDQKSTINENHLLSKEGDFSILKYFHSNLQILNQKELRNVLKDRDITLIINTNVDIDSSLLNSFELITSSSRLSGNKILGLATEIESAGFYIIEEDSLLYNKLIGLLGNLEEPSTQMAENLAKAVVNNKKKSIKVDDLFSRYREWLLENVLEIGVEIIKTQNRYFVTFRDSFLSGIEECILNFRKIFFETYLSNKLTGNKETTGTHRTFNEDIVKQDLSNAKFQVPKTFAKNSNNERHDEVRKFLDILVFAVNQPNENDLGDIIEKETGDYVEQIDRKSIASKFKLYIQDWAKQKEGRYLTNRDMERQFAVWGLESLNQMRIDDIKKYRCNFEKNNEVVKNLSNFLKSENDANLLCLYDRQTLFTKIKVCQVYESYASENVDQQFIFCDINDLVDLEDTAKCPVKAFSSQTCNVLFVSLEHCTLHNTEVKILNRLLQIVIESNRNARKLKSQIDENSKNRKRKRLILSIPEEKKHEILNKFHFDKLGIKSLSHDDFDNSFSELDEQSRRQLMEKDLIKLHGKNVTGVLSENDLSIYIRNEILLKLILSELQINGALAVVTNHYNEQVKQYYINRLLVPVIVGQEIKNDTRFRIIQEDTSQANITNQEVVVISSNDELFERLRKINNDVHWLKESNNKFFWITSQGNLSNLHKHVAAQNLGECENCIPVTNVNDLKNNVVLISASPGMGKSILLSHVAEQSKLEDTSFFVFKANLANFFTELDRLDKEYVTIEQAIHFAFIATLIDLPHVEARASAFNLLRVQSDGSVVFSPNANFGHMDHLRALVFCNLYNEGKIVLLFDGFDEIAPDYCKTTLNLLQKLKQSKVGKMWVTTRPLGITKSLEKDLETFAYTLKPLSKDDQFKFIEKFWTPKIKTQSTDILSSIKGFFSSFNDMDLYTDSDAQSSMIKDHLTSQNPNEKNLSSFMGVPLHIYMLAKVLTQKNDYAVEQSTTVIDFYSKFFDIKFDEILYNVNLKDPKNDLFRERKKLAETEFGKLALLEIFDDRLLLELVPEEDRIKVIDFVNIGKEKVGIVGEVVDNKPRFVHRTFAEYFAAHYLAEVLIRPVENKIKEAARSLLYNSVTSNLEYYSVLFTFFNYIIVSSSKNKDIFDAAIRPNSKNIGILIKADNMAKMFDPLNRTPMHLLAFNMEKVISNVIFSFLYKSQSTKTMQQFCEVFQRPFSSTFSADSLFNWTLQHYLSICPSVEEFGQEFKLLYLNFERDAYGRTPLILWILKFQSFSEIWLHLDYLRNCFKIQINIQDNFLKTALHYVLEKLDISVLDDEVWYKYFNMTCLLLKHGACINIPDNQGIKPVEIMIAVINKKTERILKHLTDDNKYTHRNFYILNFQHFTEHVEKHGYNAFSFDVDEVNKPDQKGRTALHYAVKLKDTVAIWCLINQGARPDVADMKGIRPVDVDMGELVSFIKCQQLNPPYKDCDSFDTINFIDRFAPRIAEVLIASTQLLTLSPDYVDIIVFLLLKTKTIARLLLSKFPDFVDVVDLKGKTALHYAVENYDGERVTFLIENNARVDISDNEGKMPVHLNKLGDYSKELKWINLLSPEVISPLVLTMNLYPILTLIDADVLVYVMSRSESIGVARVLLSRYPDAVNTKDSKGRTALHYAVESKDQNAVCLLMDKNAQADIVDNDGKYPAHLEHGNSYPHETNKDTYDNFNKIKLRFINTLPYKVARPLVLTMALFPPFAPSDYLPLIFDQNHTIAAVLWSVYSDLLGNTTHKEYCSYFDCSKVSNNVVCMLLEYYCIEEFSEDAVKLNGILKLVVELFSSVKNNDLTRVQKVLRCVEYSTLRPNLANVDFLCGDMNVAAHVVNARSKDGGKTALHYAAEIGNAEIVQCLLSHGSWYNAPDHHGSIPSQVAKIHDSTAVAHLLDTIKVLFDSLNKKTYDIAKGVVTKENIEGNIFNCICFETGSPLIYLAIERLCPYGYDLLKSFWKCYQFTADLFNCRKLDGLSVPALLNGFMEGDNLFVFGTTLFKNIILLVLDLPIELANLI